IVTARSHDNILSAQHIESLAFVLVWDVVHRVVEVDIIVVIVVRKTPDIVYAAHSQDAAHLVGMTQPEVHGMVAANTRANRDQVWVAVLALAERQNFVVTVFIELDVAKSPP